MILIDKESKSLISIIMPAYNCEDFISIAINSVLNQTYQNWELIIIDDCSTDNTSEIVMHFEIIDSRIKLDKLNENSGAAVARNRGVELSNGEYISFLDSDDVWNLEKLSYQLSYMKNNGINFSCTSYKKIDQDGKDINIIVEAPRITTYRDLLKNNCGNSTVMYNCKTLGKFFIPNIKKRNDYVMWLQILKKENYLYGIDKVLCEHRIRSNSLSENKSSLIKYHWQVYTKIEKLSYFYSCYLMIYWMSKTIKKKFEFSKI